MLEDVCLPTNSNESEMTVTSHSSTPSIIAEEEDESPCHHPTASEIFAKFQLNFNSSQSSLEEGEEEEETERGEVEEESNLDSSTRSTATAILSGRSFGFDLLFGCWLPVILQMGLEAYTAAQSLIVRVIPVATWYWVISNANESSHSSIKPKYSGSSMPEPNVWPPPVLVRLAVFTIFTLVVHPDGYTWVILRKLRDALYYVFHVSSSLWAIAIHDYGTILATVLALSIFACLFLLAFLLRKTLTPKRPTPIAKQKQPPVRKKRRNNKGHHHHHSRRGASQRAVVVGSHAQQRSADSELGSEEAPNTSVLPALLEDKPVSPPLSSPTATNDCPSTLADDSFTQTCSDETTTTMKEQTATKMSDNRDRVLTDDSTVVTYSDDLSYDSVSGRSTPTMAADSTSSHPASSPLHQVSDDNADSSSRGESAATAKGKSRNNRRRKQHLADVAAANGRVIPSVAATKNISSSVTHHQSAELANHPNPPTTPSRWEVLKPSRRQQPQQQQQRSRVTPHRFQQSSLVHGPAHRPSPHTHQTSRVSHGNTHRRSDKLLGRITKQQQPPHQQEHKQRETLDGDTFSMSFFSRHATAESNISTNNTIGAIPNAVPFTQAAASQSNCRDDGLYGNAMFSSACSSPVLAAPTAYHTSEHGDVNATNANIFGTPLLSVAMEEHQPSTSLLFSSSWNQQQHTATSHSWMGEDYAVSSPSTVPLAFGAPASIPMSTSSSLPTSFPTIRAPPGLSAPPLLMNMPPGLTTATTSAPAHVNVPRTTYTSSIFRDNPFLDDDDDDEIIEAELQELGGQMVGSILDF